MTASALKEQEVSSTLPHNFEAEQALLGALLHNNNALEKVSEFLRPEHFADGAHGAIFSALCSLVERGSVADPVTLKDYFENNKDLAPVGGAKYLAHLAGSVVSLMNVEHYGKIIHDCYLRRQLISIGEEMIDDANTHDLDVSAPQQIEQAEKNLFDLATRGEFGKNFVPFKDALQDAIHTAEAAFKSDRQIVGVTTGLRDLDKWLGGLHPSDLLILAGRPSMGKTGLAMNVAFNAALAHAETKGKEGAPVAFFSLEMSSEQLAARLLSQESQISSDKIRRGELKTSDFPKFVEVSRKLSTLPLYIDDTPGISITAIRNRARRLQRQKGLGMIIIDYLQLIQAAPSKGRAESRVLEVSEITRALKGLAKELNVPVVTLSQLSRAVEQRDDKRPQLSDLRESGSIEQDADVVMFIYREEYYESRKAPPEGTEKHLEWQQKMSKIYNTAEVIIAKQRHGPIGNIKLYYDSNFTKFGDLSHEPSSP